MADVTVMGTADTPETPANLPVRDSRATPRQCAALTKAGAPCKAPTVGADGLCAMHAGQDPVVLGRAGGLRSGEVRREQAKSVRDRLREEVEAHTDEIWSAFRDGLASDDERVRVATAQAVLAEAYGRPVQAIVGDPDKPVTFELVSAFRQAVEDAS